MQSKTPPASSSYRGGGAFGKSALPQRRVNRIRREIVGLSP
jgi:hypothetical protein